MARFSREYVIECAECGQWRSPGCIKAVYVHGKVVSGKTVCVRCGSVTAKVVITGRSGWWGLNLRVIDQATLTEVAVEGLVGPFDDEFEALTAIARDLGLLNTWRSPSIGYATVQA